MKAKCGCSEADSTPLPYKAAFQRPSGELDTAGHVDLSVDSNWTVAGSARPTKVATKGGREWYLFAQVQAEVNHVFEFNYRTAPKSIQPGWRLVFRGRRFEITASYDVDEARKTIRCECIEAK